jgi:hypothetical protein
MRGLPAYGVQRRANSLGVLRQHDVTTLSLLDGLVAYWKLDETSGTRIDSAGSNNLADNGSVGSTVGIQGNAAQFDGTSPNYLSTASPVLSGTGSFSASGWFLVPDTTLTGDPLIDNQGLFGQTRFQDGWVAALVGSDLYFDFNAARPTFTGVITQNTYYFTGLTYDSNTATATFYLDNTELGSVVTAGFAQESEPIRVGRQRSQDVYYLQGRVDEVGIWSRALTASEMLILYNSGAGITFPF